MSDMRINGVVLRDLHDLALCDQHQVVRAWNPEMARFEVLKIFLDRSLRSLSRSVYDHFTRSRDAYSQFVAEFEVVHRGCNFWPQPLDFADGAELLSCDGVVVGRFPVLRME